MPPTERQALDPLDRTTKAPRLRTRAPMAFRAAEPRLKGPRIAALGREREAPGLRWLKRDRAEGLEGLQAAPRLGRPRPVTAADRHLVRTAVRRRPRRLE